jgi:hypothetical protein
MESKTSAEAQDRILRERCATALVAAVLVALRRHNRHLFTQRHTRNPLPPDPFHATLEGVLLTGLETDADDKKVVVSIVLHDTRKREAPPEPWFVFHIRASLSVFAATPNAPDEQVLLLGLAMQILRSTLRNFATSPAAAADWCGCGGDTTANVEFDPSSLDDQDFQPLLAWFRETLSKHEVEYCALNLRKRDNKVSLGTSLQDLATTYHLIWQSRRELQSRHLLYYPKSMPLIPLTTFPRGNAIHRYTGKSWESHRADRLRHLWRGVDCTEVKRNVIEPTPNVRAERKVGTLLGPSPTLRILLIGRTDDNSPFSKLPLFLIQRIYLTYRGLVRRHLLNTRPGVFASIVGKVVHWPAFTGLNVNMMPIRIGDLHSLPESCLPYISILASLPLSRSNWGKIGYLTIHESIVTEEGASQRRGGVHTETPGKIWLNSEDETSSASVKGKLTFMHDSPMTVAWGAGHSIELWPGYFEYDGGLYMGSNVAGSTQVWGATQVKRPEYTVGRLGDLEHLRHYLGESETLDAGDIVWMTDTTPHESLPLKVGTKRQYFRLVTDHVNVWYENHSTPNPLGIVPDPRVTTVLKGNKFAVGDDDEGDDEYQTGVAHDEARVMCLHKCGTYHRWLM